VASNRFGFPCIANPETRWSMTDLTQLKRTALYSEELGIDLAARDHNQYFRWLLASLLFGGHIGETIARHTYQVFCRHQLTTPQSILDAGSDFLVDPIMREGGYVRYDFSKSDQILRDCRTLLDEYEGSARRLHETALDKSDLEARLLGFYGVGPITANIFLRELRPFWSKANPSPLPVALRAAASLGIDLSHYRRNTLTFVRIEARLIRMRHARRRQSARAKTPVTDANAD
jgi:endonuclease III